jgi:4-nitrophenyl phosphatase
VKRYPGYIFDLDGTLFRGDEPIPGAVETLDKLRSGGAAIRYLTNNSTKTPDEFSKKLHGMGFTVSPSEVYSSGLGTAKYLASENIRSAYVIGEDVLRQMLSEERIELRDADVDAVVVGLSKRFDYSQMMHAMRLIRSGARFVATNPDPTYPTEAGGLIPGAGSIVAAVRTCSETEPFVVGKPNPYLTLLTVKESGISSEGFLVVGDRMDTDLESGRLAGCDTFLVLSGVTTVAPPGQAFGPDVRALV